MSAIDLALAWLMGGVVVLETALGAAVVCLEVGLFALALVVNADTLEKDVEGVDELAGIFEVEDGLDVFAVDVATADMPFEIAGLVDVMLEVLAELE